MRFSPKLTLVVFTSLTLTIFSKPFNLKDFPSSLSLKRSLFSSDPHEMENLTIPQSELDYAVRNWMQFSNTFKKRSGEASDTKLESDSLYDLMQKLIGDGSLQKLQSMSLLKRSDRGKTSDIQLATDSLQALMDKYFGDSFDQEQMLKRSHLVPQFYNHGGNKTKP